MIPVYYDFHIHSCLSPCGDDDMTPGNIAGMAMIKGLQAIALTDHNSAKNCPALKKHADEYGITFIPGMELTTQEEFHVLCLFPELEGALAFDGAVYDKILPIKNRPEIYGEQYIMDGEDQISGREPILLISATDIPFEELQDMVEGCGGIIVPAHLDKSSTSMISNLGYIPPESRFRCAEITHPENIEALEEAHPYLKKCRKISSSDAHYLENINEAVNCIHVEENTPRGIIKALSKRPQY